jgi:hypothetical protein
MKTTLYFLSFILLCLSIDLSAQEEKAYYTVPVQVTLIPPAGTNGLRAASTINRFSLNIIAGYAAGLEGLEFGGLANINRDFMTGVQFAGLTNITGGKATGVQFAGFANINAEETEAVQFSGFSNINNGATKGLQAAGFMNLTRNESKTVQLAGFGNFSHTVEGVQVAGFSNISSGTIKGLQIAGFINIARVVNGVQLSVFNVADTVKKGIPIGVLSIVRNGFRELEIGFSEGLNAYISFKIGVKKFYNIFSAGMQNLSDRFRWAYGYGIGTHLYDREKFKMNLELISYHINEEAFFTNAYNDLQQAKLTFTLPVQKNISLFAGPTVNLMISDYYNPGSARTGSDFAPYTLHSEWSGHTNLKYWIGFNAGVKID